MIVNIGEKEIEVIVGLLEQIKNNMLKNHGTLEVMQNNTQKDKDSYKSELERLIGAPTSKGKRKLNREQVFEILNMLKSGRSVRQICNMFKISNYTVYSIKRGEAYKDFILEYISENKKMFAENNKSCYKLTEQDVLMIKKYLNDGTYKQKDIAEIFNVSSTSISLIKSGKTWGYINL